MKKSLQRMMAFLLSILMVLSGIMMPGPAKLTAEAEEGGAIVNPNPKIDIVVNVPSDYSGTFLDYKTELEKQLIAQGLDPNDFRITSAAVKIDTTDLSSWYVYDHYYDQATYNGLHMDAVRQPYAEADNSQIGSSKQSKTPITIPEYIAEWKENHNGQNPQYCAGLTSHIASSVDGDNKASMYFMGYGSKALTDYLFYPAAKSTKRTMSFDIEANKVDTHTLEGAGYLLNTGIDGSGNLKGYVFYYKFTSATSGTAYIYRLNGVNAGTTMRSASLSSNATAVTSTAFSIPSDTKKVRMTAELTPTSVTLQQQDYAANGSLSDPKDLFKNVALTSTGYNGVGPIVSYTSHGCSSLSAFTFSDIVMTYEDNAFESLRSTQYAESAEYRYFINLAGDSGDPHIPKADTDLYKEGLNRLNNDEIFYVSNVNDGKVLTNPTDENYGLGADNGIYAEDSESSVNQIAAFIADRFKNQKPFQKITLPNTQEAPTADFKIVNSEDQQVISVHQQHLQDNETVNLSFRDTSFAAPERKITTWHYRVLGPDGVSVLLNETKSSSDGTSPESPFYGITNQSEPGKYTYELTVTDDAGKSSAVRTTYFMVFNDDKGPAASVAPGSKANETILTLTDMGDGIGNDGNTIIPNQGSGIAKYRINTDGEIVTVNGNPHAISLTLPLESTDVITVYAWDECGNEMATEIRPIKITFDPTDGTGSEPESILIPSGTAIGMLATDPVSNDPDYDFVGWFTEKSGGSQVTAQSVFTKDTTIYAQYSNNKADLIFNANGGADGSVTSKHLAVGSLLSVNVTSEEGEIPTKEGHSFVEWTLDTAGNQKLGSTTLPQSGQTVYAQWKANEYRLIADANGGVLGSFKGKNVAYGTNIKNTALKNSQGQDYSGRDLPTRTGYTFVRWAKDAVGTALDGTETMPADEYTVYAVWTLDTAKNLYHFDKQGGSGMANDIALAGGAAYPELPTVSRLGYDFSGWYLMDGKDGQLTETEITEGGASHSNTGNEYWIGAKWTPRTDTGYTVEHYTKDENGIYTVRDTEYFYGQTDAEAVAEAKAYTKYILDEDYKDAKPKGIITADGKLVLKLYYLEQFDVTGIKYGHGTITGGGRITEGGNTAISWTPDTGYKVTGVFVDGAVRDDLLNGGEGNSIGFTDVHADHTVKVEFGKAGVNPDTPDTSFFTITTEQIGGSAQAYLSPSKTLAAGSDYTVEWRPGANDVIKRITVDGQLYPVSNSSIDFKKLQGNHHVVVTYAGSGEGSMGGSSTEGFYTITVNAHHGDANFIDTQVSPSAVVNPGATETVTWSAKNGYKVTGIVIDADTAGEKVLTAQEIAAGSYTFADIAANHVVDITFEKTGGSSAEPDNKVKVTTELVGGPGKITGSATINAGENYTVEWDPVLKTDENPESPDYAVYEVKNIVINGQDIGDTSITETNLENITDDQHVKVVLAPVLHQVDTVKYGEGTIDPSKTLFDGQNYYVAAAPSDGWVLQKVTVDGHVEYENTSASVHTLNLPEDTEETDEGSDETADTGKSTGESETETSEPVQESGDHNAQSDERKNTDESADETASVVSTKGADPVCVIAFNSKRSYRTAGTGEISTTVQPQDDVPVGVQVNQISQDHKVEVLFVKAEDAGKPVDTNSLLNVTGRVEGGPGLFNGSGLYAPGSQAELSWSVPDGYKIDYVSIKVNGSERSDIIPQDKALTLSDIQDNYDVTVYLKNSGGSDTSGGDGGSGGNKTDTYSVATKITNGEGEITPSKGGLAGGSSWQVEWSCDTAKYTVKEVRIDGITDDSYLNKHSVDFTNISANHTVEIVLTAKGSGEDATPDGKESYIISTEATAGGKIDPSKAVEAGSSHTVNWAPDAGYHVVSVIVDGGKRSDLIDKGAVSFQNIAKNHHVEVVFGKDGSDAPDVDKMHTITTEIGGGKGTIDGIYKVPDGEGHTVTWTPDEGQEVKTVIVDGQVRDDLKDKGQIKWPEIDGDHHITVIFQPEGTDNTEDSKNGTYTINTSKEGKGQISNSATVNRGDDHTVTWAPDPGYRVTRVEVDGVSQPNLIEGGKITFTDIASNHRVNVIFEKSDGTVTPPDEIIHITTEVAGGQGDISGSFTAEKGDTAKVEWHAKDGYTVDKVYVNGVERPDLITGRDGFIEFKDIQADQKIQVVFIKDDNSGSTPDTNDPNKDDPNGGGNSNGGHNTNGGNGQNSGNGQNGGSDTVKTGDETNVGLLAAIVMISILTAAAAACLIIIRKRRVR